MKKTLTVNLNSIVFHIDDDAYEMLQTYLSEIAKHFESDQEKKEIMSDIEARIAELLSEKLQKNKNVVTLEDVQEIVEIMGKPSQYAGEDAETEAPKTDKKQQKSRRFFRDPENAILGGIAGGLAAYFGWDVTLIRILMVVAVFVGIGFVIPVYIVVWFVAPAAVTASQRLEMQGEDVTVESIKAEMNNVKNYMESDKFKQTASTFGEKIFEILRWSFKIIFGFVGAVLGFVGLVLVAVLVFLFFMVIFEPTSINSIAPGLMSNWAVFTPENASMLLLSLILVVGCPIFMLVYWGIRFANGRKDSSKTASWVVLILWLAGLFMFYSVGAKTFVNLQNANGQPFSINWNDEDNAAKVDEIRNVETFTAIEISGNIELILNQDSIQSVQITASPDLQPKIITKVENGVLKIYSEQIFINRNVKANISTNALEKIIAKGACSITTESQLVVPALSLELLGASKAEMDLKVAGLFNVDIKGASEAIFTGTSQTLKLNALGASDIKADELIAKNVEVYVAGASHAMLFATESIDATAYGASDIICIGSPKSIKQKDGGASSISIE